MQSWGLFFLVNKIWGLYLLKGSWKFPSPITDYSFSCSNVAPSSRWTAKLLNNHQTAYITRPLAHRIPISTDTLLIFSQKLVPLSATFLPPEKKKEKKIQNFVSFSYLIKAQSTKKAKKEKKKRSFCDRLKKNDSVTFNLHGKERQGLGCWGYRVHWQICGRS